jgi:hypothetical protein
VNPLIEASLALGFRLVLGRRGPPQGRNFSKEAPGRKPRCDPCSDRVSALFVDRTFPDHGYSPAELTQGLNIPAITPYGVREFRCPERDVGSWSCRERTTFMPVPKAALHLDNRAVFRHHNVGAAGKAGHVQPVSQAETVQGVPQDQFGLCVFAPDASHHP